MVVGVARRSLQCDETVVVADVGLPAGGSSEVGFACAIRSHPVTRY